MNPPKVLLHLGLPKTATSSLQHNVFQRLHIEKRINFLGKCLNFDYQTGRLEVFNYRGKFIRRFAEGDFNLEEAKHELKNILHRDLLNVFSDEGIMIAYPGKENLPLSEKIANLYTLFEGYEVTVVVTLRDPVDYLYSLYVELYPEFCASVKGLNTIQKYTQYLINNPSDVLFESFFFQSWLPILEKNFDLKVFEFEELSTGDTLVYQRWSNLLGLDTCEFKERFEAKKVNVKSKQGKEAEKVSSFKYVESWFKRILSGNRVFFDTSKWLYRALGLNKLLNYRFSSRVTHQYPQGEQFHQLKALLGKD